MNQAEGLRDWQEPVVNWKDHLLSDDHRMSLETGLLTVQLHHRYSLDRCLNLGFVCSDLRSQRRYPNRRLRGIDEPGTISRC